MIYTLLSGRFGRAQTIWVFLGRGCSVKKAPAYEGLIFLDFLGFFRPDPDLSMGYTAFSENNFLGLFPLTLDAGEREKAAVSCGNA
jgi:hypothetical protein